MAIGWTSGPRMSAWLTLREAGFRENWQSWCTGLGWGGRGILMFQVSITAALHDDQLGPQPITYFLLCHRRSITALSHSLMYWPLAGGNNKGSDVTLQSWVPRKTFESGDCKERDQSAFLEERLKHSGVGIVFSWGRHSELGSLGHFADLNDRSKEDKTHWPAIIPKQWKNCLHIALWFYQRIHRSCGTISQVLLWQWWLPPFLTQPKTAWIVEHVTFYCATKKKQCYLSCGVPPIVRHSHIPENVKNVKNDVYLRMGKIGTSKIS